MGQMIMIYKLNQGYKKKILWKNYNKKMLQLRKDKYFING